MEEGKNETWNNGRRQIISELAKSSPGCRCRGRVKFHVERPNRKWKKRRMGERSRGTKGRQDLERGSIESERKGERWKMSEGGHKFKHFSRSFGPRDTVMARARSEASTAVYV